MRRNILCGNKKIMRSKYQPRINVVKRPAENFISKYYFFVSRLLLSCLLKKKPLHRNFFLSFFHFIYNQLPPFFDLETKIHEIHNSSFSFPPFPFYVDYTIETYYLISFPCINLLYTHFFNSWIGLVFSHRSFA